MRHEKEINTALSPTEGLVFAQFKRFTPVTIDTLYSKTWPQHKNDQTGRRFRQQRLGAIIATLNKKLARFDLKVMPGTDRGTYALYRVLDRPVL